MAEDKKTEQVNVEVAENTIKPKFMKRKGTGAIVEAAIMVAITIYFLVLLSKGQGKHGYNLAILVYVFIFLRFFARQVSVNQVIYKPLGNVFDSVTSAGGKAIPQKLRVPLLFALTAAGMVAGALIFELPEGTTLAYRAQSLVGIVACIAVMYATSQDRKAIAWHTVASGMFIQFLIALFVLKTQLGQDIFSYMSKFVGDFLGFAQKGYIFINVSDTKTYVPNTFALNVLPAIVFFCSFIYIVYYFGGMQYLVKKMGWLFVRIMDTSGAESCVACASPFVGQGESALLVQPFVELMTRSELHSTMVSGFATIAGSVLTFYLTIVPDSKSILTACIMSIPAGLLLSKMRVPEKEQPISKGTVAIPEAHEKEANFLHAATEGASAGMNLIILIVGSLLAIVSLYAVANYVVGWLFYMINIHDWIINDGETWVTIDLLLSYIFAPVAWLIGMPWGESRVAGQVMAVKMVVNEFVAYLTLQEFYEAGKFGFRTANLMTFALCGFANVASIGVQIGCLGAMAPSRKKDLAELAFSAMLTGTVSTWLTAAVAGALL